MNGMTMDLSSLTAVVTGGTSGIGLATVRLLLARGARVALCARDPQRLEEVTATLAAEGHGDRVLAHPCDVVVESQVQAFSKAVEQRFGGVDVLVNNAGRARVSTFSDTSDADWHEELTLKFFSVIYPVRAFLPALKRSPHAAVVCVNSLLALQPEPHMVATSAARAGVQNLVRSLAVEFAPFAIRVNSVLLGTVDSGQWQARYAKRAAAGETFEQWLANLAREKKIPLGRFGRSEEAAQAIVFLASPLSSYTTGTSIDVSGGTARFI
ncbi:MAG: SDR family oxidoreductase [Steroidobacteraceae bacterium]